MAAPVQIARFSELYKRLFGIKQNVPLQVIEDVLPTAEAYDVRAADSARLRGDHLWANGQVNPGLAGNASRFQIGFNTITPVSAKGSLLTVVDELHIWCPTAGGSLVFLDIVPNLNLNTPGAKVHYRDARSANQNGAIPPAGFTEVAQDTPALGVPGSSLGQWQIAANVDSVLQLGVVLVPFTRLDVSVNIGSTVLTILVLGHERALDPGEAF